MLSHPVKTHVFCENNLICYFLHKLFFSVSSGGAELIPSLKSDNPSEIGKTFYITAKYKRLLHAAEHFKVMKRSTEDRCDEFNYENRHLFSGFRDEDETFLSSAEKQYLIKQCLNMITSTDMGSIPGVVKKTILYKDRPVGKSL